MYSINSGVFLPDNNTLELGSIRIELDKSAKATRALALGIILASGMIALACCDDVDSAACVFLTAAFVGVAIAVSEDCPPRCHRREAPMFERIDRYYDRKMRELRRKELEIAQRAAFLERRMQESVPSDRLDNDRHASVKK